jgi:hypothetical protein
LISRRSPEDLIEPILLKNAVAGGVSS